MKTILRFAALLVTLVTLGFWFFGGPNLGFTKTSVAQKRKDPVTDLEVDIYEPRFVPGIDFLGAGLAGAAVLASCSLFVPKKKNVAPSA